MCQDTVMFLRASFLSSHFDISRDTMRHDGTSGDYTVDDPASVKLERSHVSTYCSACLAVCYRRHANRARQFQKHDALSIVLRSLGLPRCFIPLLSVSTLNITDAIYFIALLSACQLHLTYIYAHSNRMRT